MTAVALPADNRRGSPWLPRWTLGTAALMVVLYLVAGAAPADLVFDRGAIGAGEWWRLFSAHLAHTDAGHLQWNLAALLILGWLGEPLLGRRLPLVLLAGVAGVSAWLWWGMPEVQRYCGLSGVLNTVLVVTLLVLARTIAPAWCWWVGAGALAKLLLELHLDTALFTATAWPSLAESHAAGFATGLAASVLVWALHR